ncbi:MAG: hypothetical protein Q7S99_03090 [Parvibaculum sp.]|nr:hypothetical protein [Parvibaculum sp.]
MTNTDEIEALRVELGKFKTLKENAELSAIEFQMSAEAIEAKIAGLEAVKPWPTI